ncbi:MAG: hypothetical protein ABIW03_03930 [Sphingomicrobium sp.]
MFESDNRIYFTKRAAHAAELASRAADPKIAAIHHEMALRYEILSVQGSQARPDLVALAQDRRSDSPQPADATPRGSIEPEHRLALKQA